MNRSAATMALFAILLAGVRLANGPAQISSPASQNVKAPGAQSEVPSPETSCEAFDDVSAKGDPNNDGEINSLVERYLYGVPQKEPLANGAVPSGITFMIVTVPDPLHTHLSLQFDRTLEALQQAVQDEKFTYDSSWLPWRNQSSENQNAAEESSEEKLAASRERCPGLVVFRRNMGSPKMGDRPGCPVPGPGEPSTPYRCGMFVFVVAETPTAGLNQAQWLNALAWIDKYSRPDRPDKALRILGPTFSGSMPSIVRALAGVGVGKSSFTSALLYSGRIRGCGSWRWLNDQLNAPNMLPVRTSDFVENDAIQINRFYRFLVDRGHSLSEVALVSEDETAYGGLPDARSPTDSAISKTDTFAPNCDPQYDAADRPVHLYYPRDISAIRSAYQEQSIFSTGTSSDTSKTSHAVLQPRFDPGAHGGTDSIEPFSGQGMALTQEAQLYGIVNSLRTHGIRFVILRSTNSLDYLFLVRFFHRADPDVFIVTLGSDMLFGREIDSTEFRGVLALTTFPLLPRGQDWTKQRAMLQQHAHRVFGSDIMEGAYLAARFLTTDYAWGKDPTNQKDDHQHYVHPSKMDIPDYAEPFWERERLPKEPLTWLAVIGREGYWPLAVLEDPVKELKAQAMNLTPVAPVDTKLSNDEPKSVALSGGFTLSSAWKFSCFVAVLVICIHFVACQFGWKRQDLGVFAQFMPSAGKRQAALMAMGWATVWSLLLLLFLASARIYPWLRLVDKIWIWILGAFALAGFWCVVSNMGPWRAKAVQKCSGGESGSRPRPILWVGVTIALAGVSVVAGLLIFEYANGNGVLVAYRSVHLTSGISPIISLLLMLGGFYWWFWQALSGLALLGAGRPILPGRDSLPRGLSRISCEIADSIEESAKPVPDCRGRNIWFYLLPLFLLALQACVLQRPWSQGFDSILHSFENKSFNWTLHGMFGVGVYLLFLDCGQLLATWLALKRLLLALNRLPLRRTFAALQGLSMHSLWSMSGASSRSRYTIFSHQMESLVHLHNELAADDANTLGNPGVRSAVHMSVVHGVNFIGACSRGEDLAIFNDDKARYVRESFSQCTEQVIRHLLVPEWFRERDSLDLGHASEGEKPKEELPLNRSRTIQLAEEFVCLIYVGYLQNMLARMRTMVLSMAGIFVAIALSVSFYPYTPRPVLALSLLLLLLVLGAAVAAVYAGLDRDSTLSHITNTTPGTLGVNFWIRIVSFVGVPVMGLVVAQFPEITDFVASWIQPSMNAVK